MQTRTQMTSRRGTKDTSHSQTPPQHVGDTTAAFLVSHLPDTEKAGVSFGVLPVIADSWFLASPDGRCKAVGRREKATVPRTVSAGPLVDSRHSLA